MDDTGAGKVDGADGGQGSHVLGADGRQPAVAGPHPVSDHGEQERDDVAGGHDVGGLAGLGAHGLGDNGVADQGVEEGLDEPGVAVAGGVVVALADAVQGEDVVADELVLQLGVQGGSVREGIAQQVPGDDADVQVDELDRGEGRDLAGLGAGQQDRGQLVQEDAEGSEQGPAGG